VEQCSVKKGDVFFTPSSETPTDIAFSAVAMEDMDNVVYSYHIVRLRPLIDMDLHYRAYAFKTAEFYKQAQRICDGSGQRYVISQNGFRGMSIKLPSLSEQKAIAEVLTTADDEIAIHRKTLDALRLQKRGLMQQLLTGKTRVKI
jgi:type I restriction enzyme S subunit